MKAAVYYNEIDPYCAEWLQNLMDAGHIAPGVIDTRSIEDVRPDDLDGYTQCHFFAGIGGWAYALDLAGWPRDRPVWTGSCPCQPFSAAGKGNGFADQRHLWPAWFHLIREREPAVIFGEQVEGPAARVWLDLVQADMESIGYAFGGGVFFLLRASALPSYATGHGLWQTPMTRDGKGQSGKGNRERRGKNGRLHVANLCDQIVDLGRPDLVRSTSFRCALMGYPPQWEAARPTATRSSRKSRQPSSKATARREG